MPLSACSETPPRAWGRDTSLLLSKRIDGNTPTGVGKRFSSLFSRASRQKHPHGRGEEDHKAAKEKIRAETPPRAWGRVSPAPATCAETGNTPTCVGKTCAHQVDRFSPQKHPHGRGEEPTVPQAFFSSPETPPRAWGRDPHMLKRRFMVRNTPTGVGKRCWCVTISQMPKKHPHVRGEDLRSSSRPIFSSETPPRAWGRADSSSSVLLVARNTPTGVGKRPSHAQTAFHGEKHPHGRGEEFRLCGVDPERMETPPRAWGRERKVKRTRKRNGNTPTGVGKRMARGNPSTLT